MRHVRLLAISVMICMVSSLPARAAETIKIGAILGMTGPASFLGAPEAKTIGMLVDEINKKGGVLGRPLTEVRSGRGDLRDSDGHRCVVGPFAGSPDTPAGHCHIELGSARRLKLVRRPQGVSCCGAQQNTLDPIM